MSNAPANPPATPAASGWRARLPLYWQLIRGDRPVGTLLLLWPTWWALWLAAEGLPPLGILLIFTAGVWLTRSAGCVINDYADRWLDPQVERTRGRPLATGAVSPREALALFVAMMLDIREATLQRFLPRSNLPALALLALLGVEMLALVVLSNRFSMAEPVAAARTGGEIRELSTTLFADYLLPFEVASVILLVALVGAVVLARKEPG